MISIPSILLILFAHVIATDMKITFKDVAYTFLGICYIPVFMMFLTLIDGMKNGKFLLTSRLYCYTITSVKGVVPSKRKNECRNLCLETLVINSTREIGSGFPSSSAKDLARTRITFRARTVACTSFPKKDSRKCSHLSSTKIRTRLTRTNSLRRCSRSADL